MKAPSLELVTQAVETAKKSCLSCLNLSEDEQKDVEELAIRILMNSYAVKQQRFYSTYLSSLLDDVKYNSSYKEAIKQLNKKYKKSPRQSLALQVKLLIKKGFLALADILKPIKPLPKCENTAPGRILITKSYGTPHPDTWEVTLRPDF